MWRRDIHPAWSHYDYAYFRTKADPAIITHTRSCRAGDPAFGSIPIKKGIHRFSFIVTTAPRGAAGISFGVADATRPQHLPVARSWCIRANGVVEHTELQPDGSLSTRVVASPRALAGTNEWNGSPVPEGELWGEAAPAPTARVGTSVIVVCDMTERTLVFAINGSADALVPGVFLPDVVRPCIRVHSKEAAV